MSERAIIDRLRQAAAECSGWDPDINAPYSEWSDLMDDAANKIEELLDDAPYNTSYLRNVVEREIVLSPQDQETIAEMLMRGEHG